MPTLLKLRAHSRDGSYQDHTFTVSILPHRVDVPTGDHAIRQRVKIEGIDVSSRVPAPGVSLQNALDTVRLNRYTASEIEIPLKNNDGYFRNKVPGNFWALNNLNPGGFQNGVEVFLELRIDGEWESFSVFQGQISGLQMPLADASILRCFSNTTKLSKTELTESGIGINKIIELELLNSESNQLVIEGTYSPETAMVPLTVSEAPEAYHHQDALTLKDVSNSLLGTKDGTARLSVSDLRTQGGALDNPLLLNYKTAYRYKNTKHAFDDLTKNSSILTTLFADFQDVPETYPHITAIGNLQFNTERGRITRLPTSWLHDPIANRLYALLSNPSDTLGDQLVSYDIDTDSHQVLYTFDAALTCYAITTADYENFYILCGASTDIDYSDPLSEDSEAFTRSFDASEADSKIKVLHYIHSHSWADTFIDASNDYRPQLGVHYHFGFTNIDFDWIGIQPSRYSAFVENSGYLYYRYCTETAFGVARADTNGNTSPIFAVDRDGYNNHLNFAFNVDAASGDVYFAYTLGKPLSSTLYIEKFDGTDTEIIARFERNICDLTDVSIAGGAFLGVYELVVSDGFVYLSVPIAHGNREVDTSAGMVLYRYGLETLTLEKLDSSDFVHFGFAGLTAHTEAGDSVHESAVYYVQSPIEVYKYPAYNPNLASYDAETQANALRDFKGGLKRVLLDGEVEDCGVIRVDSDGAFRGLMCKCLSFNDALHMIAAKASPDTLMEKNSVASQHSNALWCTFSRQLQFVLDAVPTTGTLDAALTRIASQSNATFGLSNGIAHILNRLPIGALLEGEITASSESIRIKNQNRPEFPTSGHLLINNEVIAFEQRINNQLGTLSRAQIGTTADSHIEDSRLVFLDDVIPPYLLIGKPFWSIDTQYLYNSIKDQNEIVRIKDTFSVFSEKQLTVDLDLDSLRIPMAEFIAGSYLERFKDIRFQLNITLKSAWFLRIGDVVGFYYSDPIPPIAMQILQIRENLKSIQIIGREVAPDIRIERETITGDFNDSLRILDAQGDAVLVAGDGTEIEFAGDPSGQAVLPIFFETTLADVNATQYEATPPIIMPKAIGGSGKFVYTMSGLPANMFFNPRTRRRYGAPDESGTYTCLYRVVDQETLTIHQQSYRIVVSAASVPSQRLLDDTGDSVLQTGAGTDIIF